jgi:DNA-directed RNA polymerase sigma subunit (sigma70/sigma32)
MFESVLYWDLDRGKFSTYLFATIPGCKRAIYEEIRRKQKEVKFSEFDEDGEEPDRYEVAPLWAVDQTTKEKMGPMQEEVVDVEERKKAIAALFKKVGLTAGEEKVLRLRFGLSALPDCMVAEKPVLSPREEAKVRMLEGKLLRELVPRRFSSKGKP